MYSQSFNANNIYVKFSPFFCQKKGTEIIHIIFPPNEKNPGNETQAFWFVENDLTRPLK